MTLRTFLLSLMIAFVSFGCSKETNAGKIGFWPWFESRESEFADLFSYETGAAAQNDEQVQQKIEAAVKELGDRLREIHPEFSPFFGSSEGTNELTVSVHGHAEHFKAVDDFIASAPKIGRWKFIALKQPLSLDPDTEIQSGGVKLKVRDWLYAKTRNPRGTFDFVVYVPAKVSDDEAGFQRLFKSLIMDFLGERLASGVVGTVTVRELTADIPAGLSPFTGIFQDASGEAGK
ncbi:MAG: hypothetical protein QM755_05795 [Luteolibacter sp.]